MRRLVLAAALAVLPVAAVAVQPDEVMADPELETRARDLSIGLRCPVCRNESIDESGAPISRDIRLSLRERLAAGDTDDEAIRWLVDRYGEYVLLMPRPDGSNLLLWLAAPGLLLLGTGVAALSLRARSDSPPPVPLDPAEQARLDRILRD